jgi:hypothetical protein
MNITAHISGDGRGILQGNFSDVYNHAEAIRLIKDAIDDVGDAVEAQVQRELPTDVTGRLRAHPVDRDDTTVGISADTSVPLFGGGFAVRGPSGFVPGVGTGTGEIVAKSVFTIPEKPDHALWVHEGTGIHGPRGQMITARTPGGFMKFPASRWPTAVFKRANYRFKEVKGQAANPYLVRAFLHVDSVYVPIRLSFLDAEMKAIT